MSTSFNPRKRREKKKKEKVQHPTKKGREANAKTKKTQRKTCLTLLLFL